MFEKDMEELIKAYPSEFIEDGLELLSSQQTVTSGRIDIVFKTRFGELLVVEIKKGALNRKHLGQVLDYYAHLKEQNPDISIHPMLIGTEISKEFKITLNNTNVDYREIPLSKFVEVAKKYGYTISDELEGKAYLEISQSNGGAVNLSDECSNKTKRIKQNTGKVTDSECVKRILRDKYNLSQFRTLPRKSVMFEAYFVDRPNMKMVLCSPMSSLQPDGKGWIDVNIKQIELMGNQYDAFVFRVEGSKDYYVSFEQLKGYLTQESQRTNKREGKHWKLYFWPHYIEISGNKRKLNVEPNDIENLKPLV